MGDFIQEYVTRQRQVPLVLNFGISFLDDALAGIFPTDLIVLGAGTGIGKTETGLQIASKCAREGIKTKVYALEADPFEIHRRLKYQAIADFFFSNRGKFPPELYMTQTLWRRGIYDEFFSNFENEISERLEKEFSCLQVFTPSVSDFTKQDFSEMYREDCVEGYRLIILDHLHYLWFEGHNETSEIKSAVAEIRDLINAKEVPILMLSHLRKPDKMGGYVVPSHHELHGSSEISKRANSVITFAGVRNIPNPDNPKVPKSLPPGSTMFRICKARDANPSATAFAGLLRFDLEKKCYGENYKPFLINSWGNNLDEVPQNKFPTWMRRAGWDVPGG